MPDYEVQRPSLESLPALDNSLKVELQTIAGLIAMKRSAPPEAITPHANMTATPAPS